MIRISTKCTAHIDVSDSESPVLIRPSDWAEAGKSITFDLSPEQEAYIRETMPEMVVEIVDA